MFCNLLLENNLVKYNYMVKEYINYIKNNPEDHWFKTKLYDWGWTPGRNGVRVSHLFLSPTLLTVDSNLTF